jgi:hypothetical protein
MLGRPALLPSTESCVVLLPMHVPPFFHNNDAAHPVTSLCLLLCIVCMRQCHVIWFNAP